MPEDEDDQDDDDPTQARRERDRKGEFDYIHVGIDELPDLLDKVNPTGLFYQPILHIMAGVDSSNQITPVLVDDNRRIDMASSFGVATAIELNDTSGAAGNGIILVGIPGQIWEIRSLSLTSNAGDTYSILDDSVMVSEGTTIGAGDTDELVRVAPIPIAGGSSISIDNGLIADTWNIRAIRIL